MKRWQQVALIYLACAGLLLAFLLRYPLVRAGIIQFALLLLLPVALLYMGVCDRRRDFRESMRRFMTKCDMLHSDRADISLKGIWFRYSIASEGSWWHPKPVIALSATFPLPPDHPEQIYAKVAASLKRWRYKHRARLRAEWTQSPNKLSFTLRLSFPFRNRDAVLPVVQAKGIELINRYRLAGRNSRFWVQLGDRDIYAEFYGTLPLRCVVNGRKCVDVLTLPDIDLRTDRLIPKRRFDEIFYAAEQYR